MDEERGLQASSCEQAFFCSSSFVFTRHSRSTCTGAAKSLNVYPMLSLVVKTKMASRENWKERRQMRVGLSCLFFPLCEALHLPFKVKEAENVGMMGFMQSSGCGRG